MSLYDFAIKHSDEMFDHLRRLYGDRGCARAYQLRNSRKSETVIAVVLWLLPPVPDFGDSVEGRLMREVEQISRDGHRVTPPRDKKGFSPPAFEAFAVLECLRNYPAPREGEPLEDHFAVMLDSFEESARLIGHGEGLT